jgi:sensor histidine kinase YesM
MAGERDNDFFYADRPTRTSSSFSKPWQMMATLAFLTFGVGLMARVPVYDNKLIAITFSFAVDSIILLVAIPYTLLILRSRFNEISLVTILSSVVSSALCGSIVIGIVTLIRYFFPVVGNHYHERLFLMAAYFVFIFYIWSLAAFWVKTQRRAIEEAVYAADAERAAAVSELKRLRMQLDPHFLFNALNTATVEVTQRPKRAVLMLRELSNYLRYSLDTADVHLVPVAAEMAMARSFLRIQDIRFGAKLKHSISAQEDTKRRMIPALMLQPLIENAIKYGVPDENNVLHVSAAVTRRDDDLIITVVNTGELALSGFPPSGTGTGLSNLRSRLALHYPGRHCFDIAQSGQNVSVTCILKGEPC